MLEAFNTTRLSCSTISLPPPLTTPFKVNVCPPLPKTRMLLPWLFTVPFSIRFPDTGLISKGSPASPSPSMFRLIVWVFELLFSIFGSFPLKSKNRTVLPLIVNAPAPELKNHRCVLKVPERLFVLLSRVEPAKFWIP